MGERRSDDCVHKRGYRGHDMLLFAHALIHVLYYQLQQGYRFRQLKPGTGRRGEEANSWRMESVSIISGASGA